MNRSRARRDEELGLPEGASYEAHLAALDRIERRWCRDHQSIHDARLHDVVAAIRAGREESDRVIQALREETARKWRLQVLAAGGMLDLRARPACFRLMCDACVPDPESVV